MAKKKKKKEVKMTFKYTAELYGIIFILIAILGIGKYGPVGRLFASFALFLVGSLYMVLLLVLFIIGVYLLLKKEKPDFFTTRLIGIYIFSLGLITMMHREFVIQNDSNMALIFKETINQLVAAFNGIMNNGSFENWLAVGGGLIGGVLASLLVKLFSLTGMEIICIVLMLCGIFLVTGFSIVEFVKNKLSKKSSTDDEKSSVIIDGNIDDEDKKDDNHIKISSIDELNKVPEKVVVEENDNNKNDEVVVSNPKYQLPPITLLTPPKKKKGGMDNASIEKNIKILEQVLADFKISGKVVEVHVGPTVAQYELEIASGTRVNKILSINREIALALAKKDVRIEAPIPGKNTVGIEFANENPTPVSFYEIIASERMKQSFDKKLMVPLGKSIMGDTEVCEVNKMPHLLIAGTTGSGKSVCVNGIVCSILMRARPDEVKLVMVDPKVVELSVYNGIPHLMCPVVTDPKKAAVALAKMVAEMERRYGVFSDNKVKNIEGYNAYVDKENANRDPEAKLTKMPYIVVIIDELADLMMVAAKEVEDSILRITQKARAAGIHLIVATQRPSTEVITGLIKANIPSRISFAVGSGIDSRTILDQTGAEKLLGKGDMLYLPIGQNSPTRIQGSFITDEEIQNLIDFTVKQQKAQYDNSLLNLESVDNTTKSEDNVNSSEDSGGDELYDQIVEFVIRTQKASASLLQRKFNIGYNRAARMIDLLEERGVIGPATGNSKPREVLVQFDDNEEVE